MMPAKKAASSRRVTLELPIELYARLEALAEAERRELKAHGWPWYYSGRRRGQRRRGGVR